MCAGRLLITQTKNVFMHEGVLGRFIGPGRSQGYDKLIRNFLTRYTLWGGLGGPVPCSRNIFYMAMMVITLLPAFNRPNLIVVWFKLDYKFISGFMESIYQLLALSF